MIRGFRFALAPAAVLLFASSLIAQVPSPGAFLNLEIGADGVLADYGQIEAYFSELDRKSDRVEVVSLGETTLGRDMIMAVVSSPPNIRSLSEIRTNAARLADPRGVGERDLERLIRGSKTVVLVTCNIHSTEIGSSQMAMEWAHELATAPAGSQMAAWLDDVVLLLVPSLNPDGQQMVVDWYRQHRGTEFEGGPMPWLYHHYVGHDNNRDWFMLTQKETRALSRAIYHEWFPQIFVDHHQMGATGPRMFIPPFADPIDPDIHPLIWREIQLIGTAMAFRLEQAEKSGVIFGYAFDGYWMGGTRNTGWWKNITGLLTETASVRIATPIEIHPTELSGGGKGLTDYKPQVNFPNPWEGGRWTLRDIMEYQRISSNALLEVASRYREDFNRNLVTRARDAIALGKDRAAYRIPRDQRDWPSALQLGRLMADHGLDVLRGPNGDLWIPLAQPYSRFAMEILGPQVYPEITLTGADQILAPYDVSAWSLPLLMNVEVVRTSMPADLRATPVAGPILGTSIAEPARVTDAPYYSIERGSPETAKVINAVLAGGSSVRVGEAGTFYIERAAVDDDELRRQLGVTQIAATPVQDLPRGAESLGAPRVGVYKPYAFPSMDEGWTRFVLDEYGFHARSIEPEMIRKGAVDGSRLAQQFDAIILPDIDAHVLEKGERKREDGEMKYFPPYPEPYAGGVTEEGVKALEQFVTDGGTLIAMSDAADLVLAKFNVPVANSLEKTKPAEFAAPGAILAANVESDHPVTWGLPSRMPIFHDDRRAFSTTIPGSEIERAVLLWFPAEADEILLSGWIRGEEKLARKAAAVALQKGEGKIVLFAFSPQHRAQTHGTFPLLFNALWWSTME